MIAESINKLINKNLFVEPPGYTWSVKYTRLINNEEDRTL